jgi:hypothetical protein
MEIFLAGKSWSGRFRTDCGGAVGTESRYGKPWIFARKTWISLIMAVGFIKAGSSAVAQNEAAANAATNAPATAPGDAAAKTPESSASKTSLASELSELRLGPFDLHPRLSVGLTYDDNIALATANKEADAAWTIRPAIQAVAGDDAALITYRDQNSDTLSLSPGSLIIQQAEARPGKLFILDYGPGFQIFDKYTANNSLDEFLAFNLLWPMNRLILGFKQNYTLQKLEIIEAGTRATVETIPTTLSAAYQFSDKTSLESDFNRISIGYDQPGLIGYTEYNNEDWLNYEVAERLPMSLGVLAGQDYVAAHQGDQTFEQLRARARYNRTEKLSFDISGGVELREYENGSRDTFFPVFTVSGVYRPAERTSVGLTGYRRQYASIFNGYNYSSTGATLAFEQGITDRWKVSLSVGYYDLGYLPTISGQAALSEDYYTARIGLDAKIIRHMSGQVFYQWLSRRSQQNGILEDDQAGVQVTLSF